MLNFIFCKEKKTVTDLLIKSRKLIINAANPKSTEITIISTFITSLEEAIKHFKIINTRQATKEKKNNNN